MELTRLLNKPIRIFVRKFSAKPTNTTNINIAGLGKKAKKMLAEGIQKKTNVPVEKDPKKLVSEVCGTNLLEEGGENIKIKPDSEYPDWLWKIHVGKPLELEEMDKNSKQYWNKVNYLAKLKRVELLKLQKHKTLQK